MTEINQMVENDGEEDTRYWLSYNMAKEKLETFEELAEYNLKKLFEYGLKEGEMWVEF